MPTQSAYDAAIIAYRENPTEQNRERLLILQRQRVENVFNRETRDYQRRTH